MSDRSKSGLQAKATITLAWHPDYQAILAWRKRELIKFARDPAYLAGAMETYRNGPDGCVLFIQHWCDTFDPRNKGTKLTRMPFVLFPKQIEFVQFVMALLNEEASGLLEKARDMGATWMCVCISVWLFLFHKGSTVGWGSRKAELVDKLGDMNAIFPKIRYVIRSLPPCFLPEGFEIDKHMGHMKIYSESMETAITGEAGDAIGRGGRTRVYFLDEAAHLEHPEDAEAALEDNTRVRLDMSSVHGLNNVFHRKRKAGRLYVKTQPMVHDAVNVFVLDWREHPEKTPEWYKAREKKAESEGLLHKFRSEVDRDYAASVEGIIIDHRWVVAAIDAHIKLGFDDDGGYAAALDIADEGRDTNALSLRKGIVLRRVDEWGARDTGVTTRHAIGVMADLRQRAVLQYDATGMGSSVKAEINRLRDDKKLPRGLQVTPWLAGGQVRNPDLRVIRGDQSSPKNKDFYQNLKAQGWWELARRFERTYRAIRQLEDPSSEPDFTWEAEDLISIDSKLPLLWQLVAELSQATVSKNSKMKLVVDKTPDGAKSPNLADAIMMNYWPAVAPPMVITGAVIQNARARSQMRGRIVIPPKRDYLRGMLR